MLQASLWRRLIVWKTSNSCRCSLQTVAECCGFRLMTYAERAKEFWRWASLPNEFPRDMERAVACALPLAVFRLPKLTVGAVSQELISREIGVPEESSTRRLKGCLFACAGQGLVFLDGSDPPDEIRFILAHEASHFLLHHLGPRKEAARKLGDSILEVLDGARLPTPSESLAGVLRGVKLGQYRHAMQRRGTGRIISADVARMEAEADRLAFELLAPMADVYRRMSAYHGTSDLNRTRIANELVNAFGMPTRPASDWADQIASILHAPQSFRAWFADGG